MTKIVITFCGDFVSYNPSLAVIDDGIKAVISESDFGVVNVEAPLSDGLDRPIEKSGPVICQPQQAAELVKQIGFNVVSLANNHIMDYGENSAKRTADAFAAIEVVGLGRAVDIYQVRYLSCKGKIIGIVSGCQREFGAVDSDEIAFGYSWINDPRMDQAIIDARKKCDYLFVLPHAGVENVEIPLPEWRQRYRSFINLGADAIIASHPHIVQGYEDYRGKRIYYSLGNFYFDRPKMPDCWHHGLVVTAAIDDDGTAFTENYVTLEGEKLVWDSKRIPDLKRLNALLEAPEYDKQVEILVKEMLSEYDRNMAIANSSPLGQKGVRNLFSWLRRAVRNYRDDLRLINLLRCESHRWLYIRCLNYRSKNIY